MLAVADSKNGLDPSGPYAEFSCRVQCAVPMYGAYDFTDRKELVIIGKTRDEAPEAYRAATTPPILVLWGTADSPRTVAQCERFTAALKKAGAEHELVVVEGAPHSFPLQPKQRDLRPLVLGFSAFAAVMRNISSATFPALDREARLICRKSCHPWRSELPQGDSNLL